MSLLKFQLRPSRWSLYSFGILRNIRRYKNFRLILSEYTFLELCHFRRGRALRQIPSRFSISRNNHVDQFAKGYYLRLQSQAFRFFQQNIRLKLTLYNTSSTSRIRNALPTNQKAFKIPSYHLTSLVFFLRRRNYHNMCTHCLLLSNLHMHFYCTNNQLRFVIHVGLTFQLFTYGTSAFLKYQKTLSLYFKITISFSQTVT